MMANAPEHSDKTFKATSRFLWTASNLIRKISAAETSNKNDLNTICTELRAREFTFLDAHEDRLHLCPKCNNPWVEGKFKMRVRSIRIPKSLRKYRNSVPASSFKKKLVEYLKSKRDNTMILRCLVCDSVSKCAISKPKQELTPNIVTAPFTENNSVHLVRKKKKRKKDLTAGLKISLPPIKINKIDSDDVKSAVDSSSFQENIVENVDIKTDKSQSKNYLLSKSNDDGIIDTGSKANKVKSVRLEKTSLFQENSIKKSNIVTDLSPLELKENSKATSNVFKNKKKKKNSKATSAKRKKKGNQSNSAIRDFINSL